MPYKTVQQVADDLQLDPETVRRKIRQGELKAYSIGRSYRISDEQVNEFLTKEG